jgi:hypothetical protein
MKRLLPVLFAMACGGPSVEKVTETPVAREPRHPVEAPPASSSDADRDHLQRQFDDMQTTQEAYREAGQGSGESAGSATPASNYPPRFPAKPPKKKTGPAVQAPKP